MKRLTILVAVVAGALVGATMACAQPRHVATVADTALYEALNATHEIEQQALCGRPSCAGVTVRVTPGWDDAKSQAFNRALLPAVQAGRQFNAILGTWQPGQPVPAMVHTTVKAIADALTAVTADFPDRPGKAEFVADLARAQSIVLSVLDVALMVGGGR